MIKGTTVKLLYVSILGMTCALSFAMDPIPAKHIQLLMAAKNKDYEIIESLLKNGVNPDITESFRWTPLHNAANAGDLKMVELLIKYKAHVNARTTYNRTPLHFAANNGHEHIVEELIRNKADINAVADDGSFPLHEAAASGSQRTISLLIHAGAKVNAPCCSENGLTPLHYAAMKCRPEAIPLLLSFGAQINAQTIITEETPLHLATDNTLHKENALETVQALIKGGALINMRDAKGRIPLHCAIVHHLADVVEELIAHKAHVEALTDKGESPLQLAQDTGDKKMIATIERALAKP